MIVESILNNASEKAEIYFKLIWNTLKLEVRII